MSSSEVIDPLDAVFSKYFNKEEINYLTPLLIKWAGNDEKVISWFMKQTIPAFGNKTGIDMCNSNQSKCVIEYVQTIEYGAFA